MVIHLIFLKKNGSIQGENMSDQKEPERSAAPGLMGLEVPLVQLGDATEQSGTVAALTSCPGHEE